MPHPLDDGAVFVIGVEVVVLDDVDDDVQLLKAWSGLGAAGETQQRNKRFVCVCVCVYVRVRV